MPPGFPMNSNNPYESPTPAPSPPSPTSKKLRLLATCVMVLSLALLAYGAVGFWLVPSLPPNGGVNGRLPSVYVMGVGILATMVGLVLRSLASPTAAEDSSGTKKTFLSRYGLVLLIVIMIVVGFVISRL